MVALSHLLRAGKHTSNATGLREQASQLSLAQIQAVSKLQSETAGSGICEVGAP